MANVAKITYRYKCVTEDDLVWEERDVADGVPTVCIHEGSAFVANSLTVIESPTTLDDAAILNTIDFASSTVTNLSHTSLTDKGTHTHAQIDTHIDDNTVHRQINDGSTTTTNLWSADKISTELSGKSSTSHTHVAADVTDFNSVADTRADGRITAQKAQVNGLASLDAGGKVPLSQIPLDGSVQYQSQWDASTNIPTLADGVGTKGFYYRVSVAGSTSLDGITDWKVGDWAIFNGTVYEKNDHSDQVSSVAGKQGEITLDHNDIIDFQASVSANVSVAASTAHSANTSNPHSTTLDQVTVATTKGDLIAFDVNGHVRKAVGTNGQILSANGTKADGLEWVSNKKFITSSRNNLKSIHATWSVVDHFIYPGGSINAANVSRVLVNAHGETGVTYKIRLYDATNLTEIGIVTGKTNVTPEIINLGSLSNIPTGDAQIEVHIARTGGSDPNGILYHSVMLEYQ